MTALPDWDIASDAELAAGATAGDRAAFAGIYDRYADRLHDFCTGMLRDRDAAADCVQDVFCIAAAHLPELRDADKLRPWLYAIARSEALRAIRDRRREQASEAVPETASAEPGPDVMAARSELAELVAEAAGGLSDRDRAVLELSYRIGLGGPELAEALGVSHNSAKKMAQRLREGIERSLGALLVSRRVTADPERCAELAAILDGWDGQFTVLMRKRIARHIESCPTCDEERRRLVNPVALLGAVPVFIPAPGWLRDQTLNQVQLPQTVTTSATTDEAAPEDTGEAPPEDTAPAEAAEPGDGSADGGRPLTRRLLLGAALLAAIAITSFGVVFAWLHQRSPSVAPADVTTTAPAPTSAPTSAGPLTPWQPSTVVPSISTPVAPTEAPSTPTSAAASSPTAPAAPAPVPAGPVTTAPPINAPNAPTGTTVKPTQTGTPTKTATSPSQPPRITGIPPVYKPPNTSAPVIQ
jgi:RNA polymerase sigma factor (sigma-70 family)